MQIQPIKPYSTKFNQKARVSKADEPINQPNFKGIKGTLIGGSLGAGLTAAGVALIAGTIALPVFAGYIAVNGAISALSGHLAEKKYSKDKS